MRWWVLLLLGIFLLLYGFIAVTSIDILYSKGIMGFSALVAGGVCIFDALWGSRPAPPAS